MLIEIESQQFDIDSSIIEGILEAQAETAADKKEHGFLLCQSPSGTLVPGKKCTGTACYIKLEDCKGIGPAAGSFHSHPTVISFSLGDYLTSSKRAKEHPEHKSLECVSLLDKGIRCKALKKLPPDSLVKSLDGKPDTEPNREQIKPFFTKKTSISNEALNQLLMGTKWADLPPSEEVLAIDEGPKTSVGKVPEKKKKGIFEEEEEETSNIIQVAKNYAQEPTGKYPWGTKKVAMSVSTPTGVALVPKGMPELVSDETQWVKTTDIELPDPNMLAYGEVAQYIAALSPIILTQEKNSEGKFKILDGRHRVAGWRSSGYTRTPVVFTKETEYKD